MNNKLVLPSDIDLVFIDLEATDKKCDKKLIQFSGIRVFADKNIPNQQLDIIVNPEQELSTYIINLLKTDDETLKTKKTIKHHEDEIIQFTKNALVITFGEWDYNFLQSQLSKPLETLSWEKLQYFDLQAYLKKLYDYQLPLIQLHNFLVEKNEPSHFEHYAMYDAVLLKDVFNILKNYEVDELFKIIPYIHLLPRNIVPSHKIFSKLEMENRWINKPLLNFSPVIINELKISHFRIKDKDKNDIKNKKISYISNLSFSYIDNKNGKCIYENYEYCGKIDGLGTYDIYKEEFADNIYKFLKLSKNRGIIFRMVNKDNVIEFANDIYDLTKIYAEINFINLSMLKKKNVPISSFVTTYKKLLSKLNKEKLSKFNGFICEKNYCK